MHALVVTSEPISAEQLRSALPGADPEETTVMVVAPALQESALRFWMSDADEAIARARWVASETVEQLEEAGINADGDTGESEVYDAVQDALVDFAADRILLFLHPPREQRYREQIAAAVLERDTGVPVERIEIHAIS